MLRVFQSHHFFFSEKRCLKLKDFNGKSEGSLNSCCSPQGVFCNGNISSDWWYTPFPPAGGPIWRSEGVGAWLALKSIHTVDD